MTIIFASGNQKLVCDTEEIGKIVALISECDLAAGTIEAFERGAETGRVTFSPEQKRPLYDALDCVLVERSRDGLGEVGFDLRSKLEADLYHASGNG
ncbi:hypothetical protein [Gaiella occulta]|uniref:hypothetical protein n=1 Tax=Gaiella occulta TaxID=1002870 RepID=UPI0011C03515|nr:hypothetical protein [Gaiella occulta]